MDESRCHQPGQIVVQEFALFNWIISNFYFDWRPDFVKEDLHGRNYSSFTAINWRIE